MRCVKTRTCPGMGREGLKIKVIYTNFSIMTETIFLQQEIANYLLFECYCCILFPVYNIFTAKKVIGMRYFLNPYKKFFKTFSQNCETLECTKNGLANKTITRVL